MPAIATPVAITNDRNSMTVTGSVNTSPSALGDWDTRLTAADTQDSHQLEVRPIHQPKHTWPELAAVQVRKIKTDMHCQMVQEQEQQRQQQPSFPLQQPQQVNATTTWVQYPFSGEESDIQQHGSIQQHSTYAHDQQRLEGQGSNRTTTQMVQLCPTSIRVLEDPMDDSSSRLRSSSWEAHSRESSYPEYCGNAGSMGECNSHVNVCELMTPSNLVAVCTDGMEQPWLATTTTTTITTICGIITTTITTAPGATIIPTPGATTIPTPGTNIGTAMGTNIGATMGTATSITAADGTTATTTTTTTIATAEPTPCRDEPPVTQKERPQHGPAIQEQKGLQQQQGLMGKSRRRESRSALTLPQSCFDANGSRIRMCSHDDDTKESHCWCRDHGSDHVNDSDQGNDHGNSDRCCRVDDCYSDQSLPCPSHLHTLNSDLSKHTGNTTAATTHSLQWLVDPLHPLVMASEEVESWSSTTTGGNTTATTIPTTTTAGTTTAGTTTAGTTTATTTGDTTTVLLTHTPPPSLSDLSDTPSSGINGTRSSNMSEHVKAPVDSTTDSPTADSAPTIGGTPTIDTLPQTHASCMDPQHDSAAVVAAAVAAADLDTAESNAVYSLTLLLSSHSPLQDPPSPSFGSASTPATGTTPPPPIETTASILPTTALSVTHSIYPSCVSLPIADSHNYANRWSPNTAHHHNRDWPIGPSPSQQLLLQHMHPCSIDSNMHLQTHSANIHHINKDPQFTPSIQTDVPHNLSHGSGLFCELQSNVLTDPIANAQSELESSDQISYCKSQDAPQSGLSASDGEGLPHPEAVVGSAEHVSLPHSSNQENLSQWPLEQHCRTDQSIQDQPIIQYQSIQHQPTQDRHHTDFQSELPNPPEHKQPLHNQSRQESFPTPCTEMITHPLDYENTIDFGFPLYTCAANSSLHMPFRSMDLSDQMALNAPQYIEQLEHHHTPHTYNHPQPQSSLFSSPPMDLSVYCEPDSYLMNSHLQQTASHQYIDNYAFTDLTPTLSHATSPTPHERITPTDPIYPHSTCNDYLFTNIDSYPPSHNNVNLPLCKDPDTANLPRPKRKYTKKSLDLSHTDSSGFSTPLKKKPSLDMLWTPLPISLPHGAPGRPFVPPDDFDEDSSRKLPTCPVCGQSFTRAFNLNSHLKSHENVKPFACDMCGMSFTRRHDLNRHIRQHMPERPFSCDRCDRTFLRKDALKRHERMHEIHEKANINSCII
ncbi:hypothetical protein BASA50_007920 [Batrachochytrium salamandrivorans]|uniref:C2H2-type domain-containing protein n=1 Tax=Batrachochytrium salamandrivorans TaxID=1357716 RepID=A0ABQ8F8G2_9FUNG|nr:hypothetical protein BASA50_007920 [Batrachochytrium salamandrivorans]